MKFPLNVEIIGGKLVCLDLIQPGSCIISGGVGNDIDFELELIKRKNTKVIGLDPTNTADDFIANASKQNALLKNNYTYIKKAITNSNQKIKMYYGENDFMSSISSEHRDSDGKHFFWCECVSLSELLNQYKNISYLKLDIEGAEYEILENLNTLSVPQFSIEFHHHCSQEYSLTQSLALVNKIENMGYEVLDYGAYHGRKRDLPNYVSKWSDLNCEFLFIHKSFFPTK